MKTGQRGIELIKRYESLQTKAYRCPAGIWTIGYGHTSGVKEGDTCTPVDAEKWLREDLKTAEAVVSRECPSLTQNQFDALVSFVFNCGEGNFLKSTLLRCVKANPDNLNIRYELSRWTKSKGVQLAGLMRRRREEADLYFS